METKLFTKFIAVDNHEAVNVGDLRQGNIKVVKPPFTADFQDTVEKVWKILLQGPKKWAHDVPTHVEAEHWGPPPVDADWHASVKESKDKSEKAMYYHKELHQAVRTKKPGDKIKKAKALWAMEGQKMEIGKDALR